MYEWNCGLLIREPAKTTANHLCFCWNHFIGIFKCHQFICKSRSIEWNNTVRSNNVPVRDDLWSSISIYLLWSSLKFLPATATAVNLNHILRKMLFFCSRLIYLSLFLCFFSESGLFLVAFSYFLPFLCTLTSFCTISISAAFKASYLQLFAFSISIWRLPTSIYLLPALAHSHCLWVSCGHF